MNNQLNNELYRLPAAYRVCVCTKTTVSQDVQTWFSVQLAFAKFLSKIKEKF